MTLPTPGDSRARDFIPEREHRFSEVVPARSLDRNSERPGAVVQAPPRRMVDVFLRYLQAEGVRHVFAIPGGLLHPFMAAVEADASLTLVMPKHEEGAAFMADGYARTTGKLAVCAGTSGPGATNLVTGVACAYADGVPMVVITVPVHEILG